MLAPDRLSCFWPGLAQAWWRGSVTGLVAATFFGWALCILLLATFVWPNWFWSWLVTLCWLGMFCFWLVESVRSHWLLGKLQQDAGPVAGDARFVQAQQEYLRGNWFDAESLLHELLSSTPRDAEAHLLLASVLRRSDRVSAASRRLDQLALLDTAARWAFEIRRERQLIAARVEELKQNPPGSVSTDSSVSSDPSVAPADGDSHLDQAADLPESDQSSNNATDKAFAA